MFIFCGSLNINNNIVRMQIEYKCTIITGISVDKICNDWPRLYTLDALACAHSLTSLLTIILIALKKLILLDWLYHYFQNNGTSVQRIEKIDNVYLYIACSEVKCVNTSLGTHFSL